MSRLFVILGLLVSFGSFADEQWEPGNTDSTDAIMAEIHGTCTRHTCPPGTTVKVDASKDDTSTANSPDGKSYDLLNFKKVKFTVLVNDAEKEGGSDAKVSAPGGAVYFIQWIFLKKA